MASWSDDFGARLREFEEEHRKDLEHAISLHSEFLSRYPFAEQPERIEELTAEGIYNPGTQDYFLYWIEFKLKSLGRIAVGGAGYAEAAKNNEQRFRQLLKTAVDPGLGVAQKIDAPWESIPGFGGDKLVAKKIIFCYNPGAMLPIFKTEHLEHFARELGVDYAGEAYGMFGKSYNMLSTGQKCELLNVLLTRAFGWQDEAPLNIREALSLARFLYETYPPPKPIVTIKPRPRPLHPLGALFEPQSEQEVLYLFSVLHRDLDFPYVLKLQTTFPDAVVIDKDKRVKTIEFELRASHYIQHGHPQNGCDFVVCWENDLDESEEGVPAVLALKDFVTR